MKSILLKNLVMIILIGYTVFFCGCSSNYYGTKKDSKSVLSNSVSNLSNDKINLSDIKTKAIEDLNILSDKLCKAEDANSINNILSEYYELNRDKTPFIYYAKESGEFYLNPKQILPGDYDARKRPWYIESVKNTNYISEQYQDVASGNNMITFAKTVSKNSINIGVIGIDRIVK